MCRLEFQCWATQNAPFPLTMLICSQRSLHTIKSPLSVILKYKVVFSVITWELSLPGHSEEVVREPDCITKLTVLANDKEWSAKVHSSTKASWKKSNKRETCPVWSSVYTYRQFNPRGKWAYMNLARNGIPSPWRFPSLSISRTPFSVPVGHGMEASLLASHAWPPSSKAQRLYPAMLLFCCSLLSRQPKSPPALCSVLLVYGWSFLACWQTVRSVWRL